MDQGEIIRRLKGHLRAKKQQNGRLTRKDLWYCENYVMDFLLISKSQAKQFVIDNIPEVANLC